MHRWKTYIEELEANANAADAELAVLTTTIEKQNAELARLRRELSRKDSDSGWWLD